MYKDDKIHDVSPILLRFCKEGGEEKTQILTL